MMRFTGLWRHREFLKYWTASAISDVGSQVTALALPLIGALTLAATPWQMGLLTASSTAPILLVGLFAGVWVDRRRRRPVLIAADVGRALLLLTIPLASVLGLLTIAAAVHRGAARGSAERVFRRRAPGVPAGARRARPPRRRQRQARSHGGRRASRRTELRRRPRRYARRALRGPARRLVVPRFGLAHHAHARDRATPC